MTNHFIDASQTEEDALSSTATDIEAVITYYCKK